MKKSTRIFILFIFAFALLLALAYMGHIFVQKNSNGESLDITAQEVPATEEEFTYGDGVKSTANWQACRNHVTDNYNQKTHSGEVTAEEAVEHQKKLQYCNTLFP